MIIMNECSLLTRHLATWMWEKSFGNCLGKNEIISSHWNEDFHGVCYFLTTSALCQIGVNILIEFYGKDKFI